MSSDVALQRLNFRLIHDAELARAMRLDPSAVLQDIGLSLQQRKWLLAVDPRAFAIDFGARARTLTTLTKELKVSAALTTHCSGPEKLEAFFGSAFFHGSVQHGTSLVLALCSFLRAEAENGRITDARVRWTALVEEQEARLRRVFPQEPHNLPSYSLSPRVALLRVPAGTLELLHEVTAWLAEREATNGSKSSWPALALGCAPKRDLLLEATKEERGQVRISYITPQLASLLDAARNGGSRKAVEQRVRALGASADEQAEILHQLCADGLLLCAETSTSFEACT